MTLGLVVFLVTTLAILRPRCGAQNTTRAAGLRGEGTYVAEVQTEAPKRFLVTASANFAEERVTVMPPSPPSAAESPIAAFPEIHFKLPEASPGTGGIKSPDMPTKSRNLHTTDVLAGTVTQASAQAANLDAHSALRDIRGCRTRYLKSRYQDIAMLMPPLDSPQRLLDQAGRIYDEGGVGYATRLLKYSAYSRPYAEQYWLALLELLYREKSANDYLVNAKWFRQYFRESANWDEVQRIGHLLNPAAPLFASAAAWSHKEPSLGTWLPTNHASDGNGSGWPELKLGLAS